MSIFSNDESGIIKKNIEIRDHRENWIDCRFAITLMKKSAVGLTQDSGADVQINTRTNILMAQRYFCETKQKDW